METNSAGHQERQQTTKKPENRQACPVLSLRGKQLDHQRDRRKPQYTIVAIITVIDAGSTDARRGFQKEFEAIIAAVIGGCLLTGGYGSAIGAFFGSIIFGMVVIGLTYTDFDQDWFQVFLGGMLLIAVLFNHNIQTVVVSRISYFA